MSLFSATSSVTSLKSGGSLTSKHNTVTSLVAELPPLSVTVTVTVNDSVVSWSSNDESFTFTTPPSTM